jgi:hypothetical protein
MVGVGERKQAKSSFIVEQITSRTEYQGVVIQLCYLEIPNNQVNKGKGNGDRRPRR